jgi:ABC-type transporter MlaC component
MRKYIHDGLLAIAFFQVTLAPVNFLWLHLTMSQYGKWSLSNIAISGILGPMLVKTLEWLK